MSDELVVDNPAENRYEIREGDILLGLAEYRRSDGRIEFVHTEVGEEYGGRGLAGKLVKYALDQARAAGDAVYPFCPYVRSWIAKHPEYVDLVPESARARFGY